MAVPGQSFVRVRDVTDPQLQTGVGPFHDLALRFLIAACWRLTFQFFGALLLPIGLFDERELNFLPEAAAGEIAIWMVHSRLHAG